MPRNRRRAGVVRLDLQRAPSIVGGDSVAAAELLQVGEEEAALPRQRADAAVDRLVGGTALGGEPELQRERVVAIGGIIDGVQDDRAAELREPLADALE